jgi:hypothetical protein
MVFTTDAGAERGVAVGMRFYLPEREYPNRSDCVEWVGPDSCRMAFHALEGQREAIEAESDGRARGPVAAAAGRPRGPPALPH